MNEYVSVNVTSTIIALTREGSNSANITAHIQAATMLIKQGF